MQLRASEPHALATLWQDALWLWSEWRKLAGATRRRAQSGLRAAAIATNRALGSGTQAPLAITSLRAAPP